MGKSTAQSSLGRCEALVVTRPETLVLVARRVEGLAVVGVFLGKVSLQGYLGAADQTADVAVGSWPETSRPSVCFVLVLD